MFTSIDDFAAMWGVSGLDAGVPLDTLERRLNRLFYNRTECGGWLRLVIHPGTGIDSQTGIDDTDVKAVEIGTIIEGLDAELGPYRLEFPFSSHAFWAKVLELERTAAELWEEFHNT